VAGALLGAACSDDGDDNGEPVGDFAIIVGCSELVVPQGDLDECPITVSLTGGEGETVTLNTVELLRAGNEVMTDFNYGQGISMYTEPIPDNLAGEVVGTGAPLSAVLRIVADVESPVGQYQAGIRITYTRGGSTLTETVNFTFEVTAP
jgi:hypothetical protein